MIRIGLRMRHEATDGTATGLGGGTAVLEPASRERPGTDGLCDACGAAWPCARCGERLH
jgi:hypothetical protein